MFKKKRQKNQEKILQEQNMPRIRVMPSVFLSAAAQKVRLKKNKKIKKQENKKPAEKSRKKHLIHPSILILIIFIIGALGSVIIYLLNQKDEPANNAIIRVNNPPVINTNKIPAVNTNTNNGNAPKLFCGDKIISKNLGEECDDGNKISKDGCSSQCRIEIQPSFTQQITLFTSYSTTTDSDEDFLTNAEENLYNTGVNNMDEDGDTYLDGLELINLYDPQKKTPASLADSGIINIFNNEEQGYSLFYPNGWKIRYANDDKSEVYFESSTVEFVQVLVLDNPLKESITAWVKKQFNDIEISKLERVSVGDKLGIKSPNGLTINFANEDKIYSATYQISTLRELNFKATFQMMYNSLKLYPRGGATEPLGNQWPSYINNQLGIKLQYPINLNVTAEKNNLIKIDDFILEIIGNAKRMDFDSWFWETLGIEENEYCELKNSELKIGKMDTFFVGKSTDKIAPEPKKTCKDEGYYAISDDKKKIIKLNIGGNSAREMAQILATIQFFDVEKSAGEFESTAEPPTLESPLPIVKDVEQPVEPELPLFEEIELMPDL
ncbi:MAG: myxococcus cysteine-rich repeat containing protein [bacterium]